MSGQILWRGNMIMGLELLVRKIRERDVTVTEEDIKWVESKAIEYSSAPKSATVFPRTIHDVADVLDKAVVQ